MHDLRVSVRLLRKHKTTTKDTMDTKGDPRKSAFVSFVSFAMTRDRYDEDPDGFDRRANSQ